MSIRTRLQRYFGSRDRGWILVLIVAAAMLYAPFFGNPLFFDDLPFFYGGVAKHYAHLWPNLGLRWLPYATLGWTEMAFSHVVTHFFHVGNLLFHVANAILLFHLLRLLAQAVAPNYPYPRMLMWAAWTGALLFVLHPVAVYAAGYVMERSILMATFFALIMQLAYIKGLLSGRWGYLLLAAAAYFMAVFSKEHSFLSFTLVAAETLLLRGQIKAKRRDLVLVWLAFAAIGVLIMLRVKGVIGTPYEAMAADLFKQQGVTEHSSGLQLLSILTQMGLFFKYLLLWLVPYPYWMSIDMRQTFLNAFGDWQAWVGATAFLAYGAIGARLLWKGGARGLFGLALLYPWMQFTLEFSTVRVQELFVLYRSYLWMPGLFFVFPAVLLLHPRLAERLQRKTALLGVVVLAALLGTASANRLWEMSSSYRLWNDAVRLLACDKVPGADRIYFNRGQAEENTGDLEAAVADFRRSLAESPQYAPVHFELGWTLARLNRLDEAMQEFEQAIKLDPKFGNSYFGMGLLLKMKGKPVEAKAMMEKACDLKVPMACVLVGKRVINNSAR